MNAEAIRDIHWDHYFPLHYTDCDYYYRLKLAGLELVESPFVVEHLEGGSNTQRDLACKIFVESNYPAWRHYYQQKWGGDNGQEKYSIPFNGR